MTASRLNKIAVIFAIVAAICLYACEPSARPDEKTIADAEKWQLHRLQVYDSLFPTISLKVRGGDMVTRLGSDITSEMLRQMNQTDQSFSHCGIASIEHDTIFVYHAIGGEFNPDQKIKRETLYSFGHPSENKSLGFFKAQLDSAQVSKLIAIAQHHYQIGTPFDMKFDYNTDDRQYCAEFVAKAYSHAKCDSSWFQFSTKGNFRYVAVDNLTHAKMMSEIARYSY